MKQMHKRRVRVETKILKTEWKEVKADREHKKKRKSKALRGIL